MIYQVIKSVVILILILFVLTLLMVWTNLAYKTFVKTFFPEQEKKEEVSCVYVRKNVVVCAPGIEVQYPEAEVFEWTANRIAMVRF